MYVINDGGEALDGYRKVVGHKREYKGNGADYSTKDGESPFVV